MRVKQTCAAGLVVTALSITAPDAAEKIKVLVDQDSAGPQGTNFLSLLMLLMSEDVELLGITTVSGDQWVRPATVFALHALELTGRPDVPVVQGAEMPLLNRASGIEDRESLHGSHPSWHGSFNPDAPPPERTWDPPGGPPTVKPRAGHAADFIIETLRAHPGEVVLYCAGPLTNLALAVRLAPDIVGLARSLHVMGASRGGGFELNWWWDPEATRIAMSAPWKKIVITPVDISVKTSLSDDLKRRLAASPSKAAQFIAKFHPPGAGGGGGFMWDEISVLAFLDPSVITQQQQLYVNIDIDHGPGYGQTIFVEDVVPGPTPKPRTMPSWWRVATVQWDLDLKKFYDQFVTLMTR